ncbi:MAG: phosphate ABC transporter permease subunit PstC, partial [Myxococcota bacterium]
MLAIAASSLLLLGAVAFWIGRRRALLAIAGGARLHSRPVYHGHFVALACAVPGLALLPLVLWLPGPPAAFAALATLCAALAGLVLAARRITPEFRARPLVEGALRIVLLGCSLLAILVTIGIVLSLVLEALRFFSRVPLGDFLFGLAWSPQTAIRADQVGSSGAFGAVPVFAGTLLITAIAMTVAVPIGLLSAIYLSEYAGARARALLKPALEVLAGIPTVVYGFFAALSVGPAIRALGERLGLDVASESALAAGLVMGVMIIPFVSSLSDDVINAVPQSLREGSLGLGATPSETIRRVILPAALPGIVAAVLL